MLSLKRDGVAGVTASARDGDGAFKNLKVTRF